MLALATGLAEYPFDPGLPLRAEVRSRTCGSTIAIGLMLDQTARVDRIGMQVNACAIGQASAMLLARHAKGASSAELKAASDGIANWLACSGPLPPWPGIEVLAPALAHPGRHSALILPWTAVCNALSSSAACG
jgi:NifU-like protein involved in Fe-S cluster formation